MHKDDDDFIQPGTLYRKVLSPAERDNLVGNIVWHLSQGVERFMRERAVKSRAAIGEVAEGKLG